MLYDPKWQEERCAVVGRKSFLGSGQVDTIDK